MEMAMGVLVGRALTAVAGLGVADLLKDGPRSAQEIAAQLKLNEDAVYRVLRAVTVAGVFAEQPGRRFALTPLSELLRSDVPGSMRASIAHLGLPSFWHALAEIEHSLKTGLPSFDKANGMPVFEWFARHEDEGRVFDEAMTGFSALTAEPVAKAYDFSSIGTLIDIGGGHGGLLAAIVTHHPTVNAILFDQPHVAAGAPALLESYGLENKITIQNGNFFDAVPAGADVYIMKGIIHDWNDEGCIKILDNCRRAMNTGGRVLVVDQVVADRAESGMAKIIDLLMMTIPGGKERTEEEFRTLFRKAGLKLCRIVPTESFVSIVEGQAA
jgi:hypothetical protein